MPLLDWSVLGGVSIITAYTTKVECPVEARLGCKHLGGRPAAKSFQLSRESCGCGEEAAAAVSVDTEIVWD